MLKKAWTLCALPRTSPCGNLLHLADSEIHLLLYLFIYLFIYCFLGLHLRHLEVPRLRVESQPQPQQRRIGATSANYTTAHGNAGSLTH